MPESTPATVDTRATQLLLAAGQGDNDAAAALLPLVYEQLRQHAQLSMLSERPGHTLGATGVVHEAYLKLLGPREVPWQSRAHFFAAAAEAMKRILLDHAKARGRVKRGGGVLRVPLEEGMVANPGDEPEIVDVVALEAAICRLEEHDARAGKIVRLRFYAGLEIREVALALGVSERTVKGDWAFARAWLSRALRAGEG